MKRLVKVILVLLIIICAFGGTLSYMVSSPSKEDKSVKFEVEEGETYLSIATKLKNNNLIRSEILYKVLVKLDKYENLEFGEYILNENNNLSETLRILSLGSNSSAETITLTFNEGLSVKKYISIICENFHFEESDVLDKLKDDEYLDKLINKYWFINDDVKNSDLYYSLEGYLYPDTYEFYMTSSIEDIFDTLLSNMDKKLSAYKETINNSNYSIHELLTLASIVELESKGEDRNKVAGVFYNRLNDGWSLGSDVTTYYASRVDMSERDLRQSELDSCNNYNTRHSCMSGKLPIGPICNPSITSIDAAINPVIEDYYYFVADKNGKTYFNKTSREHNNTINSLKKEGLWFEY